MGLLWSHAVVYVSDMDAMVDFYTDVLGFEVTDRGPIGDDASPEIVFMSQDPGHHHQLAFLDTRAEVGPSNSVNHFAFKVEGLADLKTVIEKLESDGRASKLAPRSHGNAWSVYFSDPEQAKTFSLLCLDFARKLTERATTSLENRDFHREQHWFSDSTSSH